MGGKGRPGPGWPGRIALVTALAASAGGAAGAGPSPWTDHRTLALAGDAVLTPGPRADRVLELRADFAADFDNPFDPRQVALDAEVTAPDGSSFVQPGFFMIPYTRSGDGVALADRGEWRVRILPDRPGAWKVALRARDRSGREVALAARTIGVGPPAGPGVIRRSPRDDRYFAYADGKPYFPVGLDVCWAERHGLTDYDRWFKALGDAGGNWARIWMIYWHLALEGRPGYGDADYHGAGVYSMVNAARLDELFEIAARHGINLMLCLDSFNELHATPGDEAWKDNPYQVAGGGPLKSLDDFWTDPEAARLYKQKLRYLVARWGARPDLFAWEFWNEVDGTDDYDSAKVSSWHAEMGDALRALDPQHHLITTSYGNPAGDPAVWRLPEIEFVQIHHYDLTDTAAALSQNVRTQRAYAKPVIVGEFGANVDEDAWVKSHGDPKGIHLATALWAVPLAEAAGTPMIWYWGNYVARYDLWHLYAAVGKFLEGVDWTGERFRPAEATVAFRGTPPPGPWRAVTIRPDSNDWGARQITLSLSADGSVSPPGGLCAYLYGDGKPEFASPLVIRGEFRDPTALKIHVMTVSDQATLVVTADGATVYEHRFRCTGGAGEWKRAIYKKEWNVYQNFYDRTYEARIPAGTREIRIENTSGDWMTFGDLTLDPGRARPKPPLDVYGLTGDRTTLVYLKQTGWTWARAAQSPPLPPCPATRLTLAGVPAGTWRAAFVSTATGAVTREVAAASADGLLSLDLPPVATDLALKLTRR